VQCVHDHGRIEPRWFSNRHTESIRPSNRFESIISSSNCILTETQVRAQLSDRGACTWQIATRHHGRTQEFSLGEHMASTTVWQQGPGIEPRVSWSVDRDQKLRWSWKLSSPADAQRKVKIYNVFNLRPYEHTPFRVSGADPLAFVSGCASAEHYTL